MHAGVLTEALFPFHLPKSRYVTQGGGEDSRGFPRLPSPFTTSRFLRLNAGANHKNRSLGDLRGNGAWRRLTDGSPLKGIGAGEVCEQVFLACGRSWSRRVFDLASLPRASRSLTR